jgi:hypothetical protein
MNIAERRHRTAKKINKRLKMSGRFAKWVRSDGTTGKSIEQKEPHRLHKWNFTCSCSTCSCERGEREFKKKKLDQIVE